MTGLSIDRIAMGAFFCCLLMSSSEATVVPNIALPGVDAGGPVAIAALGFSPLDWLGCTRGMWITVQELSQPIALTGSWAEKTGLAEEGLKVSSLTVGWVAKNGFSDASGRGAGEGAGD